MLEGGKLSGKTTATQQTDKDDDGDEGKSTTAPTSAAMTVATAIKSHTVSSAFRGCQRYP